MKMRKAFSIGIIIALLLGGCSPWIMVGGNYENATQNFKAEFPQGWRKFNLSRDDVLITKDGLSLQFIRITRNPIEKDLQHTEKKFSREMLPQEAAEIVLQNFRSNSNILNKEVLANDPALIGGYPGFNLVLSFQTKAGLSKRSIVYGFLSGDSYYEILYEAAKRYYFKKDESDFEKVKDTFKLLRDNV